MPKTITHTARLKHADDQVAAFLKETAILGVNFGCLLVQLPPSLRFDTAVASSFFEKLRSRTDIAIACEPRHESWFAAASDDMLSRHGVARVAADPARVPAAAEPGGSRHFSYFRLHGSPRVYYSAYSEEFIAALATRLTNERAQGSASGASSITPR